MGKILRLKTTARNLKPRNETKKGQEIPELIYRTNRLAEKLDEQSAQLKSAERLIRLLVLCLSADYEPSASEPSVAKKELS